MPGVEETSAGLLVAQASLDIDIGDPVLSLQRGNELFQCIELHDPGR